MKKILIFLPFIILSHSIFGTPFSDWSYETDAGTMIGDTGRGTGLLTSTNKELSSLTRWYFYNNHIIGEYDTFINPEYVTAYFILNETNGDLKTYNNKELFEIDLRTYDLQPIFWKVIGLALVAFGGAIWKFITGKREKDKNQKVDK